MTLSELQRANGLVAYLARLRALVSDLEGGARIGITAQRAITSGNRHFAEPTTMERTVWLESLGEQVNAGLLALHTEIGLVESQLFELGVTE